MKWLLVSMIMLAFAISGCLGGDPAPEGDTGNGESDPRQTEPPEQQVDDEPIQVEHLSWMAGECLGFSQFGLTKGINHDQVPLSEAAQGQPFVAEFALDDPWQEVSLYFWGGDQIGDGVSSDTETVLEGTVPDYAAGVALTSCGGLEAEATFTVSAAE